MPDEIERLYQLADAVDTYGQQMESATPRSATTAQDPTGAVSVTLAADGAISSLHVAADWERRVDPAELGGAVVAASQVAAQQRLEAWAQRAGEAIDTPVRPTPTPLPSESLAAQLQDFADRGGANTERVLDQLLDFLTEVSASIDDAAAQVTQAVAAEGTGSSDGVTARVDGCGRVTAVTYRDTWLRRTHPTNIARHTLLALDAARRELGGRTAQARVDGTRLAGLAAQSSDPYLFAHRIGLV